MTESRRALASSGRRDEAVPNEMVVGDPIALDGGGETGPIDAGSEATARGVLSGAEAMAGTGGGPAIMETGMVGTCTIGCEERTAVAGADVRWTVDVVSAMEATAATGGIVGTIGSDGISASDPASGEEGVPAAAAGDDGGGAAGAGAVAAVGFEAAAV
jgi:hypothetical protein